MKITLVSPPLGSYGRNIKGLPIAPPALEYLAGLTRQVSPEAEIALVDGNLDSFDADNLVSDAVGFTVLTPQAPWAYQQSDILRKRGIPVIMGGIHTTSLPEEAALHADSIVMGEAESVWRQVMQDVAKGSLQALYRGVPLPLDNLPLPLTDLLANHYRFGSFFTSRGCPEDCNFCAVPDLFGRQVRLRPIPEVVKEIAGNSRDFLFNTDDNIWGYNMPHTIELFREIAQNRGGKKWFGACNLEGMENPGTQEMLDWGRRSGLTFVKVGWRGEMDMGVNEFFKTSQGQRQIDIIKRVRASGIDVLLFIMVGSRKDTREDFESIIRFCDEQRISVHPVMLTPLPNTRLFEEYREFLVPGMDWDMYDGTKAVFQHPSMNPEEREAALINLWVETSPVSKILKRLAHVSLKGFPAAHISSFMVQYQQSRAFTRYAEKALTKTKTC